jgi:hypothetical protein
VLASGGGVLDVEATSVRWWPNGRWTKIDPFPVRFTVTADVAAGSSVPGLVDGATASTLTAEKQMVRVVSVAAPATPEAMRGTGGTLVAARVSSP